MHPDETLDELGFFKEKPINESGDAAILIEFRQKNSWPRDWIALAQKQISMFLDSIRPVPSRMFHISFLMGMRDWLVH